MKNNTSQNLQSIELTVNNNRPVATSIQIARHFGKRHNNVVRAIDNIITNLPDDVPPNYHVLNFEQMIVSVEIAKGAVRQDRIYLLTRDGFMLLTMGFTGKEAMRWKIKYIEAFNKMEAELMRREQPVVTFLPLTLENEEEHRYRCLVIAKGLLGFWAFQDQIPYKTAENLLCAYLNISSLDDFTTDHFADAWDYIFHNSCFVANEGQQIKLKDKANIERLMTACVHFKDSQDLSINEIFNGICGASIKNAISSDPAKFMTIVWGAFNHFSGYTLGRASIIKELADNAC